MIKRHIFAMVALALISVASADEFDAVINDASRSFTKKQTSAEELVYGKLKLDSKGKVVSMSYQTGVVTKNTKVAIGKFDEKKNKWTPGAAIDGGLSAELFNDAGKVVQVRITTADDKKTIQQILVKSTDMPLVMAESEFDAILKQIGPQTNGRGQIGYVRLELDEKGNVIKTFGLKTGTVSAETKVGMGRYNDKEKKWEWVEEIPNGLYGDIFKDLGAKTIYVRIAMRDDRRGISQILVRQVGEKKRQPVCAGDSHLLVWRVTK